MGPRAGLDWRKFRPYRDSIPDHPARSSVAIPTELPGPHKTDKYDIENSIVYCFGESFHLTE